jgi:3-oxoacyl-[acyl-carrier-protein] synthase II
MKRVVVTGLGVVSPLGNDVATFWNRLKEGHSGAGPISHFDASRFRTRFACEVKNWKAADHLTKAEIKRTDPFTQFALGAAVQAWNDGGLSVDALDPFELGVIWGTGQGGMLTFEQEVRNYTEGGFNPRFNPFFVPKLIANMASGMISMRLGLMGINYTTVSACASGNSAIMDAFNYIRWGQAKAILTGGSEAPITEASVGGFASMKAMSIRNDDPQRASRPFDIERDGFVMGEGAGALLLEEYDHAKARGATIYGEVAGASSTADAYHMTATHPEGAGAYRAMQLALKDAQMAPSDVDYLNTHATSTPTGDLSEMKAVHKLFGEARRDMLISATKSMTGHLLGAAGAIEAMACILTIRDGVVPPTINTERIDPELPEGLRLVTQAAQEGRVRVAMSNTFGFGGHNGIVVFREA